MAILLSHTGHKVGWGRWPLGWAWDVPGHSFCPPAMARVVRWASQTMLPGMIFGGKENKYWIFDIQSNEIPFNYTILSRENARTNLSVQKTKKVYQYSLPESRWPSREREAGWRVFFQVILAFFRFFENHIWRVLFPVVLAFFRFFENHIWMVLFPVISSF